MAQALFASEGSLLSPQSKPLPAGYTLRALDAGDHARGHLEVLAEVSSAPDVGEAQWLERFRDLQAQRNTYIVVVEAGGRLVASGTLFLEKKFIRGNSTVGHIEDIAVRASQQGKGLGQIVVTSLAALAPKLGAYKTILDCSDDNRGFYERCGFERKGCEMSLYH